MRKNFSRDNRPGKPADHAHRFDYKIIEPLIQLRKDGVRKVGAALGLPASLFDRIPFPGPALAARVLGEVTPDRVKIVKDVPGVVSVTYNITPKPPSTIEAV